MTVQNELLEIKPYSNKDLASFYGVHYRTMQKWIQPFIEQVGPKQGRFYTVAQVTIIIEKLGVPYKLKPED